MRISMHWERRRKILADDAEYGPISAPSDSSWRRILLPFRRQSTSANGTLLHRQPSGLLTVPYDSYPQTPRTSCYLTAYYSAKPLPPIPSPESSLSRGSTARSHASPSVSSAMSSPPRSTTTCSSPVIRPQNQERLVLTSTSRYPIGIAGNLYDFDRFDEVPMKKQSLAKTSSFKCFRGKLGAKDLSDPPPLPKRMVYDSYLV